MDAHVRREVGCVLLRAFRAININIVKLLKSNAMKLIKLRRSYCGESHHKQQRIPLEFQVSREGRWLQECTGMYLTTNHVEFATWVGSFLSLDRIKRCKETFLLWHDASLINDSWRLRCVHSHFQELVVCNNGVTPTPTWLRERGLVMRCDRYKWPVILVSYIVIYNTERSDRLTWSCIMAWSKWKNANLLRDLLAWIIW